MKRKFGFVFDRDIADIRWFGNVVLKTENQVLCINLAAFINIDSIDLILIQKIDMFS